MTKLGDRFSVLIVAVEEVSDFLEILIDQWYQSFEMVVRYMHFSGEIAIDTIFGHVGEFIYEESFSLALIKVNICIAKELLLLGRPGQRFMAEQ